MGWFNAGSKESVTTSQATTNNTTTVNTDKRLVSDGSSIGLSLDNATSTIFQNVLDGGAIQAGADVGYTGLLTGQRAITGMADTASNSIAGMGIVSVEALKNMFGLGSQVSRDVASLGKSVQDSASQMLNIQSASQTKDFSSLLGATVELSKAGYGALSSNLALAKDLNSASQTAYAGAASQASGTKNIVMAGMVVVGIAAIMAFGKH